MALSGLNVMNKLVITRFFTQKGDILDFEIQCGNKRLFGSVLLPSGIFKLEHCSFDISEAVRELKLVQKVAINSIIV